MNEIISKTTLSAIKHYGDRSTLKFYEFLKKGEFKTTYCKKCDKRIYVPRSICPFCLENIEEWVDMSKTGKIYAFTQQERSLRFGKPDVIGIVELTTGERVLTKINGEFKELKIGMEVELDFLKIDDNITLHSFTPKK